MAHFPNNFRTMKKYKAKFKDEAGFYTCTWFFDELEDFWAAVCREERVYKSKFQKLILD